MTFRAKPVTRRKRPSQWEGDARQQLLVTIGFIALIVVALLILVGAVGATYYNDHLKTVATVNGTSISKDQWTDRQKVDTFRLDTAEQKIRDAVTAGQLDQNTAQQEFNSLEQGRSSIPTTAMNNLIDAVLQGKLAKDMGVSVDDAAVSAALTKEATTPEQRHVLAIFVAPQVTGTNPPTAAQTADAKAKAEAALAELKAGKAFADVAKKYSTDSTAQSGGDYGFISAANAVDKAWVDAIFQLSKDGTTDVVEGADGTFRIGRVTEIVPARTDPNYQRSIEKVVSLAAYRDAVRADVTKQKLGEKVVADATTGLVDQVHAYEIWVSAGSAGATATGPEIKASHILYSPNGDPNAASTLPANDPAWAAAQKKAQATADKLRAITDPAKRAEEFATIAKAESNDTGSGAQGGDLGYFTRATMVKEFGDAVFEGTHQKYDIIGPVKTQFGWHVILYVDARPSPKDRVATIEQQLSQPGADFQAIAKANSDALDASSGGDMGWVARLQQVKEIEEPLFALQPGQVSSVITQTDGFYIYKVVERAKRAVDAVQKMAIEQNGFDNWYGAQKAKATITQDPSVAQSSPGITQ